MSFATPQPEKGFGMDFGALPPEINSGRMYSGPGSGPMLAAAAAWDGVAVELGLAATGYDSVRGAAEDHQLRWGGRTGGCVGQLAESQ